MRNFTSLDDSSPSTNLHATFPVDASQTVQREFTTKAKENQKSNRYARLLEFPVNHRKQTTVTLSNRYKIEGVLKHPSKHQGTRSHQPTSISRGTTKSSTSFLPPRTAWGNKSSLATVTDGVHYSARAGRVRTADQSRRLTRSVPKCET